MGSLLFGHVLDMTDPNIFDHEEDILMGIPEFLSNLKVLSKSEDFQKTK